MDRNRRKMPPVSRIYMQMMHTLIELSKVPHIQKHTLDSTDVSSEYDRSDIIVYIKEVTTV